MEQLTKKKLKNKINKELKQMKSLKGIMPIEYAAGYRDALKLISSYIEDMYD